jgi:hypothetical protein
MNRNIEKNFLQLFNEIKQIKNAGRRASKIEPMNPTIRNGNTEKRVNLDNNW